MGAGRLKRLAEDPEQRTFELAAEASDVEEVLNSTELRAFDIELDACGSNESQPLRATRSARSLSRKQLAKAQKFVLPTKTEQGILGVCW